MPKIAAFLLSFWVFLAPFSIFAAKDASFQAHLYIDKSLKTALVEIEVGEGTHVYWKNPGDTGAPLNVKWILPDGVSLKEEKWPKPGLFKEQGLIGIGYEKKAAIAGYFEVEDAEKLAELKAVISGVACSSEQCLPFSLLVESEVLEPGDFQGRLSIQNSLLPEKVSLPDAKRSVKAIRIPLASSQKDPFFLPEDPELSFQSSIIDGSLLITSNVPLKEDMKGLLFFEQGGKSESVHINLGDIAIGEWSGQPLVFEEEHTVLSAMIFAFIGGLILNLMPCVLPVISLKLMSLVKMAGGNKKEILKESLTFSLGVLVSFWLLGVVFLILQWSGQSLGWGFQLQEPWFIGLMVGFLLISALSFFGVFEMGTGLAGKAAAAEQYGNKNSLAGSFWSGVLATAIATPCTGPFLGSALGFALVQPATSLFLIFTTLGLGLSFPYLLCGFFPKVLAFMPKPGAWMQTFREFLGFSFIITVLWLLFVFQAQTSTNALFLALFACILISFGCWAQGKWVHPARSMLVRRIGLAVALLFMGLGFYTIIKASSIEEPKTELIASANGSGWEVFSREKVDRYLAEGVPVFIDFTSKWCLICQGNHLVLMSEEVQKAFQEKGVVTMKADWTKADPLITEELKKFGRSGVPLYLYYDGKSAQPKILPQVLTKDNVIEVVSATQL